MSIFFGMAMGLKVAISLFRCFAIQNVSVSKKQKATSAIGERYRLSGESLSDIAKFFLFGDTSSPAQNAIKREHKRNTQGVAPTVERLFAVPRRNRSLVFL